MENFEKILTQTQLELGVLEHIPSTLLEKAGKGITITKQGLEQLREQVLNVGFKTTEIECAFFKSIKPKVESQYIYYKELFVIASRKPRGGLKRTLKFYRQRLVYYESYLQDHFEFYLYYQQGLCIFDEQYFLRGKKKTQLYSGKTYFTEDSCFSTNRDGCLAILLAYEQLIQYLGTELETPTSQVSRSAAHLTWTGRKVDLVELVYALHSAKVLNYGKADLKHIVKLLEQCFEIKLGDVYRTFLEIRARKIEPTKFLNSLKMALELRMYEADE